MKRRMAYVASMLLFVTAVGCHRRAPVREWDAAVAPSKPLPTGPLTAHFKDGKYDSALVTDGHPEYTFMLSYGVKGGIDISPVGRADWPGGTKVVLGTQPTK